MGNIIWKSTEFLLLLLKVLVVPHHYQKIHVHRLKEQFTGFLSQPATRLTIFGFAECGEYLADNSWIRGRLRPEEIKNSKLFRVDEYIRLSGEMGLLVFHSLVNCQPSQKRCACNTAYNTLLKINNCDLSFFVLYVQGF